VLLTNKESKEMPQKDAKPTETMNGARALVLSLIAEGVDTLFGYPGGAIMPTYDKLFDYLDQINHVLTRHEQGSVHAAQGYARTSGKVGVAISTSGPGATNMITGLGDAMMDSNPIVCITGQVASQLLGTDAFQETDVVNTTIPVTKWNVQVTRAEDIPEAIAKAFYIAKSGRPGPVVVDITKDAQISDMEFKGYEPCKKIETYFPNPELNLDKVKEAAALINQSKKPYILAGQGILLSGAEKEAQTLAEKADIPVASTLLGLSAFPTDHPLYNGFLGMHGNYSCNKLLNECDLLISIGMRFDDRITGDPNRFAKQAKIIHFDIDASEIDKIIKTDVGILADAKEALSALLPLVNEASHKDWLAEFKVFEREEYNKIIDDEWFPKAGMIRMGEVVHKLSEKTEGKAVVVSDVGQHQMITSRYYDFKLANSHVTSGGMGTMGFGLPAAMVACLGASGRETYAIVGDGGFQMTLQELGTIASNNIPLKIIILNNRFLGMVRQWQQLFFDKRYSFTDIDSPDFVKLADAYGIPGKSVEVREHLDDAIDEMRKHDGPYLLEINVEKEDNVFPMVPSGACVSDMMLELPSDK